MTVGRRVSLTWSGRALEEADAKPSLAKSHPLQLFAGNDGRSQLAQGDNLTALRSFARTHPEQVTMAYLDPPFLTNRMHEAVSRKTGERRDAFDDRWTDRAAYLEALAPRLAAVRQLLAPHGSMVVHVDPKTSHYVKVLCDEIFGEECFASEIVWRYRRWPAKTPNFQRVHDVLLRYRRCARTAPRWSQLYEPLAASTLATWGTAKQRAVFEVSTSGETRRARSSTLDEETRGVPLGDVWEIGVLAPVSRERTGYPSQKPEALVERLVQALTVPGDLVLDPYAGSGTTLAVAARLGRPFLGADASEVAIETMRIRLAAHLSSAPPLTSPELLEPLASSAPAASHASHASHTMRSTPLTKPPLHTPFADLESAARS